MPKIYVNEESRVGPQGNRVEVRYEKDESGDPVKRSQEIQEIIAQMILLSHKRGRVKKETEEKKHVA